MGKWIVGSLPDSRFFPARTVPGKWLRSSPVYAGYGAWHYTSSETLIGRVDHEARAGRFLTSGNIYLECEGATPHIELNHDYYLAWDWSRQWNVGIAKVDDQPAFRYYWRRFARNYDAVYIANPVAFATQLRGGLRLSISYWAGGDNAMEFDLRGINAVLARMPCL